MIASILVDEVCYFNDEDFHKADNNTPWIVGIGNNRDRKKIVEKLGEVSFGNAISGLVASKDKIGNGVVIALGAVIQINVKIGHHVIVNTSASIDHDCIIGCLLYTSPSPRDRQKSRMPSSA